MNPQQTRKLRAKIKPRHIRQREVNGTTLHYVEGWHVISEANRIFGFDGWDREAVDVQCVYSRTNGSNYTAAYTARIRIRVRDGMEKTIREGSGAGEATAPSPGQAHEWALKAAETDATKRALMTFGNAFGLSLYGQAKTSDGAGHADTKKCTSGEDHEAKPIAESSTKPNNLKSTQPSTAVSSSKLANSKPIQASGRQNTIDKSQLAISEPKRERNKSHLKFVASRYCVICGRNRSQAHHLKFAQANGMGIKTSDEFTVPLCSRHHRELHQSGNERAWWKRQGIDPQKIARELWRKSQRKETIKNI